MKKVLSGFIAALLLVCSLPVVAFAEEEPTEIEPIIVQQIDQGGDVAYPDWLAYGPITQHPAEGGTWQYGFWDAKVRSYYIKNLYAFQNGRIAELIALQIIIILCPGVGTIPWI